MQYSHAKDPCAIDSGCLIPPSEFVRLRYFFGQRLGVVDLADEQSYLVGKQRLHNRQLHGVGVLCGLRAERYRFAQASSTGTATTLLRVNRGAALDDCGREIVVGWDQCIDVGAWFLRNRQKQGSISTTTVKLWIALCYRECPSDPAPAPRDPCGCDSGGCEHSRIREGFELRLLSDAEAEVIAKLRPVATPFVNIIGSLKGTSESELLKSLARNVAEACSSPRGDSCILLASFNATLDSTLNQVVDISEPDNTIPERDSLISTAVLQQQIIRLLAAVSNADELSDGPQLGAATFAGTGMDAGSLEIEVIDGGVPLSESTFAAASQFKVSTTRFKDDGTWESGPAAATTFSAAPSPKISIKWADGLVDGGRYRVVLECNKSQPPVDRNMRSLSPLSWTRNIHLVKDTAGTLVLAETLYP